MNKVTVTIQGANYIMVGEKTDKEILTIASILFVTLQNNGINAKY